MTFIMNQYNPPQHVSLNLLYDGRHLPLLNSVPRPQHAIPEHIIAVATIVVVVCKFGADELNSFPFDDGEGEMGAVVGDG